MVISIEFVAQIPCQTIWYGLAGEKRPFKGGYKGWFVQKWTGTVWKRTAGEQRY